MKHPVAPCEPVLRITCEGQTTIWRDGPVRIGRAPDNHLVALDASLSRHHAEILLLRSGWSLRDLDSANGVWRAGVRVPNVTLRTGEEVLLGKCTLQVIEAQTAQRRRGRFSLLLATSIAVFVGWVAVNRVSLPSTGSLSMPESRVPDAPPDFGAPQAAAWVKAGLAPGALGADVAAGRLALVWRARVADLSDTERRDRDELERILDARLQAGLAAYLRAAHVGDRTTADAVLRELSETFPPADPRHGRVVRLTGEAP